MSENTTSKPKAFEGWAVYEWAGDDNYIPVAIARTEALAMGRLMATTGADAWYELEELGYTCRRVRIEVVDE